MGLLLSLLCDVSSPPHGAPSRSISSPKHDETHVLKKPDSRNNSWNSSIRVISVGSSSPSSGRCSPLVGNSFKVGTLNLSMNEVSCLIGEGWLWDSVMNAAIAVMASEATPKGEGEYNPVMVFDVTFGQLIQEYSKKTDKTSYIYSKVRKMMINRMKRVTYTEGRHGTSTRTD